MSSREIAELVDKRHDHVMRDIRKMLIDLGKENLPNFGGVYIGGNGEERPCFHLPKRESLILVSGYDVHLRARIIDRWQELEDPSSPKVPLYNPTPRVRPNSRELRNWGFVGMVYCPHCPVPTTLSITLRPFGVSRRSRSRASSGFTDRRSQPSRPCSLSSGARKT